MVRRRIYDRHSYRVSVDHACLEEDHNGRTANGRSWGSHPEYAANVVHPDCGLMRSTFVETKTLNVDFIADHHNPTRDVLPGCNLHPGHRELRTCQADRRLCHLREINLSSNHPLVPPNNASLVPAVRVRLPAPRHGRRNHAVVLHPGQIHPQIPRPPKLVRADPLPSRYGGTRLAPDVLHPAAAVAAKNPPLHQRQVPEVATPWQRVPVLCRVLPRAARSGLPQCVQFDRHARVAALRGRDGGGAANARERCQRGRCDADRKCGSAAGEGFRGGAGWVHGAGVGEQEGGAVPSLRDGRCSVCALLPDRGLFSAVV